MADEERTDEFKVRRFGMADIYGTTAEIELRDNQEIMVWLHCGQCGAHCYPTPEACRQLAAGLMDVAEAAEK